MGLDRFSPRRHHPDRRDVEVAEYGKREGPGNRCCRHEEEVRGIVPAGPFFNEGETLQHSESMLFIDNDET